MPGIGINEEGSFTRYLLKNKSYDRAIRSCSDRPIEKKQQGKLIEIAD